jgi:type IV pilus assembly protein PilA
MKTMKRRIDMNLKKKQSGFTLIELMIVIAIIGVLASVALPQYTKYISKAKISEVIAAMSTCKAAVSERFQVAGVAATSGGNFGCEEALGNGARVTAISTSDEGHIQLTIDFNDIDALIPDGVFVYLENDGQINAGWDCGVSVVAMSEYMPGNCTAVKTAAIGTNWST